MKNVLTIMCGLGLLLLAGTPSLRAETVDPNNPPMGRFADEWMEIHMSGGKVGYAHMTMTREGDHIVSRNRMHMRLQRADVQMQVEVTKSTTETIDATPVSFSNETSLATMKTSMRGAFKDGEVTVTTSQYGMDQTRTFEFPPNATMTWGAYRASLQKGFEPGTKYELLIYEPDVRLDDAVKTITRIGKEESFTHDGKTMSGQRVEVTLESPMGTLDMVSWMDDEGRPLKSVVPAPGLGDMVMVLVDEETALKEFVPPEMFMTTTIPAGREIDRANVQSITYRVFSKDPETKVDLTTFPDTAMQEVRRKTEDEIEIVARRIEHSPGSGDVDRMVASDMREFTESNLMINTEDQELINLAKRAAGGEKDPWKLGDKLRRFVSDYIDDKTLSVGFATASETCRRKEGDCSEHGVLLAALGRINGLPSRVVAGLAYVPLFGAKQDIFGYHMWTQFYIDGRWIDFDAALEETEVSPARITFATSSLRDAGMADLSLAMLDKIGQVDLEIIAVDGKPVATEE